MTAAYSCPLPGCDHPVPGPAVPCGGCREASGPQLREAPGTSRPRAGTVAALARRDAEAALILAQRKLIRAPESRRSQRCWVCEERRTCRRDASCADERWICRDCEAAT